MTKKKINFKEIYPHVWNQYELLYNAIQRYSTFIQFFVTFDTLVLIVIFELYKKINTNQIPLSVSLIFLFFIPMIIMFLTFIPRKIWVPWIEKEKLKEVSKGKMDFYEEAVVDTFGVIHHIRGYEKNYKLMIRVLLNSFIIGIFLIPIMIFFQHKFFCIASIILSILIIILFLLNFYLWNKEFVKNGQLEATKNREFFNELLGKK